MTIASALGVHQEQGRPLLATLVDWLRPKQLLLILDNCEHLIDACATVIQAVLHEAPDLRVLATSRELLGLPGEAAWRVRSLTIVDPAVVTNSAADLVGLSYGRLPAVFKDLAEHQIIYRRPASISFRDPRAVDI